MSNQIGLDTCEDCGHTIIRAQSIGATAPPRAEDELAFVARLMSEHRLDSVEMPSGLKVLKTTHAPFLESSPSPEAVDEAATRRLEALGLVNATEESGRVPIDQDELMFVSSRAPELSLDDFRPAPEPGEESHHDATDE